MERSSLERLQLKRLQATVRCIAGHVPFYQQQLAERGLRPTDIRSLEDVRRLPFTASADLRATYPKGLVVAPANKLARLHTSSGTTGKPKALFFTRKDVDNAAELIARSLVMTGITPDDVFQNMMTYGLFTGALVMHYGAEKVGCLVIPAGPGNSEKQLLLMQDFRSTAIHITPAMPSTSPPIWRARGSTPARTWPSARPLWERNLIPRKPAGRSNKPSEWMPTTLMASQK